MGSVVQRLSRRGGQRQAGLRNTEGPPRQGRDAEGKAGGLAGAKAELQEDTWVWRGDRISTRWTAGGCPATSGPPVSSLGALPLSLYRVKLCAWVGPRRGLGVRLKDPGGQGSNLPHDLTFLRNSQCRDLQGAEPCLLKEQVNP